MRSIASTVAVITTGNGFDGHGMTATAVCAVSAEPPSVLIVVNRSAQTHDAIAENGCFAVNVLAADQEHLAQAFASSSKQALLSNCKFGLTGSPLIDSAANMEADVDHRLDYGTHTIFVGRIVSSVVTNRKPLLYHRGRYQSFDILEQGRPQLTSCERHELDPIRDRTARSGFRYAKSRIWARQPCWGGASYFGGWNGLAKSAFSPFSNVEHFVPKYQERNHDDH